MIESAIDTVRINFNTETLWILNVVLALIMFGVSLEITPADFKQLYQKPKPVLVGILSQFLLLPLLTFILVILIEPIPSMALGMFMVAACPGGNISNFISSLAKGNTALSVTLTANATLMAILMTPFNLSFWGSLYVPTNTILKEIAISPIEMVEVVALILGIPLLAGMWINHKYPDLARGLSRFFKGLSLLFFVALIIVVILNNWDILTKYIWYVFWIVFLHNLIAFLSGFSLAKLLKLSGPDIRSITVETGIQNSGLGLVLIFTFFDGLGGMAVLAAFWGVWHLISGLLLSSCWAYKPIRKEEVC